MDLDVNRTLRLLLVGVIGGFQSGLFGVGGGIVMVPLLLWLTDLDQRRASATSLVAIVPASLAGTATYLARDAVDWRAGLLIAIGGIAGAQVGTKLLAHLPITWLRWMFIVAMLGVGVRTMVEVPARGADFTMSLSSAAAAVGLGVLMGIASGLFGVGGGMIAVPGLMIGFGVGDLLAKGTSLLAMIPTAASGTVANRRRGLADVRDGTLVGIPAMLASTVGAQLAFLLSPTLSATLFGILILAAAAQLGWRAAHRPG